MNQEFYITTTRNYFGRRSLIINNFTTAQDVIQYYGMTPAIFNLTFGTVILKNVDIIADIIADICGIENVSVEFLFKKPNL